MKYKVIQGSYEKVLPLLPEFTTCFADPPDGIKLNYDIFKDAWASDLQYAEWLLDVTGDLLNKCQTLWMSYNAKHDIAYKAHLFYGGLGVDIKPFVQTFTFGQYRDGDCANNHRPLLRLRREGAPLCPAAIKVPSWRELNGDKRAKRGGRVPGDVWDFTRVTGNSEQRRTWHPTQLNEGLVERAIKLTTPPNGTVLDMFSGTGTTLRVCKRLGIPCTAVELSGNYCRRIAKENDVAMYRVKGKRLIKC